MSIKYYLGAGKEIIYKVENNKLYFRPVDKTWRTSMYHFEDLLKPIPLTEEEAFELLL